MEEVKVELSMHYFLSNNLHEINAKTLNVCETNTIALIEKTLSILGIEAEINFIIQTKGGWRDIIKISPKNKKRCENALFAIATSVISGCVVASVTQSPDELKEILEQNKEAIELKKQEIQLLNQNNQELANLNQKIDKMMASSIIFENPDVVTDYTKKQTKLYSTLQQNNKIKAFSVESVEIKENNQIEYVPLKIVEREHFPDLIVNKPTEQIETDENATIIIIAPVLNGAKFQWKGDYNNQVIDFSMTDRDFKKDILSKNITFGNNDVISGVLEIKKKINSHGEVVSKKYALRTVYETEHLDGVYQTKKGLQKIEDEKQMCLFDEGNN